MNIKLILLSIITLFSISFATFQKNDKLILNSDTLGISIFPLEDHPLIKQIIKAGVPSDNKRGYIATWKIDHDRLYLVNLKSETAVFETAFDSTEGVYKMMTDSSIENRIIVTTPLDAFISELLFDNKLNSEPIEAKWFTGIIIPNGARWGSATNEEEVKRLKEDAKLIIEVKNGKVIGIVEK